jgi:hypothetical protein
MDQRTVWGRVRHLTLALLVVVLAFVLSALADRNVTLLSSRCTSEPNSSTISCTWGDIAGCRLSASDSYFLSYCTSTNCHQANDDPAPGCTTSVCCLMNTTTNDACNAFTSPVFSRVTSCIKPPPCDPMSICP